MDWQSCEVFKPFDPLLLDRMLFVPTISLILVLGIMSLLVLLTAFLIAVSRNEASSVGCVQEGIFSVRTNSVFVLVFVVLELFFFHK